MLFIQYTHCACERMVEYVYLFMRNLMYASNFSTFVCVCLCAVDHITFKHRNPRHFSVITDTSHIHTRKIIDSCVTQNSVWLEEGIIFPGV
jgi:hypothetical protein